MLIRSGITGRSLAIALIYIFSVYFTPAAENIDFNDVDVVSTYSSPDIKYFTGCHLVYAIVALLCEEIIVIGFPLLLLLEPLLSQKVNFVRIKPLNVMYPFQHCYKRISLVCYMHII